MTSVDQQYRANFDVPQKYHPLFNFGQLLQQWYILKKQRQRFEELVSQGYNIVNPNQVKVEYGNYERMKIF